MKKTIAILLILCLSLAFCACGTDTDEDKEQQSSFTGVEDGILTVAMECNYAPYNWAQTDDSNGAVKIKDSVLYANGYDVQMAKSICEYYGWQLEIVQLDWNSLVPAVQSKTVDAVIAGQSITSDRLKEVDFAGPYLYASIVCIARSDSKYASAKGISDLAGGSCTSQISTVWYDTCLPQIKDANIMNAYDDVPPMILAAAVNPDIFVCTDMPTAQGAVAAYPELTILDFNGTDDNFEVSEEEINIGISILKGNSYLKEKLDSYLSQFTEADFNERMSYAVSIQPSGN